LGDAVPAAVTAAAPRWREKEYAKLISLTDAAVSKCFCKILARGFDR
jgi:hypothetical protein